MQNKINGHNEYKSGFVAILGEPNAGKSTLVNRFVGEKVSIVSPKPQTTRDKLSAVLTTDKYQIVFVDTPGAVKPRNKLARYMQKSIESAQEGTDIVILVIDALKGVSQNDCLIAEKYSGKPFICLINKIDEAEPRQVMPLIKYFQDKNVSDIYPISAKTGENVDLVLNRIVALLPAGEKYFPDGVLTDRGEIFCAAEIIREKALYYYQQEIPHGIGVNITKYEYIEDKDITEIDAEIFCEKEGHKAIIIGKDGQGLKKVGAAARRELERMAGGKVFLSLWVKVKKDWRNNDFLLRELGYDSKNV
jgi:GTP-binding protein Era